MRVHDLADDSLEARSYVRWVRDIGYALLASLRQQLRDVPWGERPLKFTLDADGLGLLAAALGALRRQAQERPDGQPNPALAETRQRLWLSVPLDMEITWWLGSELVSNEPVPLLRMIRIQAERPSDDRSAERLLQAASAALQTQHSDVVRFVASLGELAWLTCGTARSAAVPCLPAILP
ncbi:MAG: hypothetical protein ACK42I_07200 [Thermomicrobium sp.]